MCWVYSQACINEWTELHRYWVGDENCISWNRRTLGNCRLHTFLKLHNSLKCWLNVSSSKNQTKKVLGKQEFWKLSSPQFHKFSLYKLISSVLNCMNHENVFALFYTHVYTHAHTCHMRLHTQIAVIFVFPHFCFISHLNKANWDHYCQIKT